MARGAVRSDGPRCRRVPTRTSAPACRHSGCTHTQALWQRCGRHVAGVHRPGNGSGTIGRAADHRGRDAVGPAERGRIPSVDTLVTTDERGTCTELVIGMVSRDGGPVPVTTDPARVSNKQRKGHMANGALIFGMTMVPIVMGGAGLLLLRREPVDEELIEPRKVSARAPVDEELNEPRKVTARALLSESADASTEGPPRQRQRLDPTLESPMTADTAQTPSMCLDTHCVFWGPVPEELRVKLNLVLTTTNEAVAAPVPIPIQGLKQWQTFKTQPMERLLGPVTFSPDLRRQQLYVQYPAHDGRTRAYVGRIVVLYDTSGHPMQRTVTKQDFITCVSIDSSETKTSNFADMWDFVLGVFKDWKCRCPILIASETK